MQYKIQSTLGVDPNFPYAWLISDPDGLWLVAKADLNGETCCDNPYELIVICSDQLGEVLYQSIIAMERHVCIEWTLIMPD